MAIQNCENCGAIHKMKFISSSIPIILLMLPLFISIWSESIRNFIRNSFPSFLSLILAVLVYDVIVIGLSLFIARYKLKDSDEMSK